MLLPGSAHVSPCQGSSWAVWLPGEPARYGRVATADVGGGYTQRSYRQPGGGCKGGGGHSLEAPHLVWCGLVLKMVGLQLDQIHLGLLSCAQATRSRGWSTLSHCCFHRQPPKSKAFCRRDPLEGQVADCLPSSRLESELCGGRLRVCLTESERSEQLTVLAPRNLASY